MTPALLLLLAIGQTNCPNGQCPRPTYMQASTVRHWYLDAKAGWVRGWKDASGNVWHYPSENTDTPDIRKGLADAAHGIKPEPPKPEPTGTIGQGPLAIGGFNYGLDESKVTTPNHKEHYRATGDAGRAFVAQLKGQMIGADLTDDSTKAHVTIIGSEGEQRDAVARLRGVDAKLTAYGPDDWQVKNVGMVRDGKSEIVIQRADGVVINRLPIETPPGPVIEAVRKADPKYDPNKDGDGSPFGIDLSNVGKLAVPILIGLAALYFIFNGKARG